MGIQRGYASLRPPEDGYRAVRCEDRRSLAELKVAGFGLYNDSTTGSEFAILADKFYVYAQKEDGSSYNVQVFTVDATTTPPTVGINGNLC